MRKRITAALVKAVVENRNMSIAGLVGVLAVLAAKFGLHLGHDTLVWLAVVIIGALGAAGGDNHDGPTAYA